MRQNLVFMSLTITMVFLPVIVTDTQARQFRFITPINSPSEQAANVPDGAMPLEQALPLSRGDVEPLVRQVIDEWNTFGMAETLSEQFYDKSRFLDVMNTRVPRDATLKIQGIQGIQTVQQYIMPDPGGGRGEMVSIVSATVQTQLEFNSPTEGFVRLQGTNEFILKITSAVPP